MHQSLQQIADMADLETDSNKLQQMTGEDSFLQKLEEIVCYLIEHDFEKLLWILYRIDVDEQRIKTILSHNIPANAPKIMAELILERLRQKEKHKATFKQTERPIDDEDLML